MSISSNRSRYDNFCLSFGQLDDDEFQLVLDLTLRFHCLSFNDLIEEFLTGYYSVPDRIIQGCNHLLIVPMKKMDNRGCCVNSKKSGDMLMAQMKQFDSVCYYNDKFIFCKNAKEIKKYYQKGDIVCFIDDFVGSGKTFIDAYLSTRNYLQTMNINLLESSVIGVSAWAMDQGKREVMTIGLQLYCYQLFKKEISDYYPRPHNIEHKMRMYNIENKVCTKIKPVYRLGYGHCEALVSIAGRCANNTFPIYWKTKKAAFPR